MKKIIRKFFKTQKGKISHETDVKQNLEIKVEEGTKKAIREYREVFEKLAEYDRA